MKRVINCLIFFLFGYHVFSQDTIVTHNNSIIKAKVSEITADEIKYKVFGVNESPTIFLKKSEVKRVSISGQTVFDHTEQNKPKEDVLIKKNGDVLKIKLIEVGTEEIKFKKSDSPDSPIISLHKSEIKILKVEDQVIIDSKTSENNDVIIKKDGTSIKVIVVELSNNEVKYKLSSHPASPVLSLSKKEVRTVTIDGQVAYEYKPDPYSVSNQAILNKTNVLKFYFLSPLYNNIAFGYEWVNKPGFNWDIGAGIIGIGAAKNSTQKPKGMFLRFGPKFLLGNSSDLEVENARLAHPLKGKYIKVEAILNAFSSTNYMDTSSYFNNMYSAGKLYYSNNYQSITLNLQYGKQSILGNTLAFAWYIGVGYSFETNSTTLPGKYLYRVNSIDIKRYSHTYYGERFPLATTMGITLGYLFKGREKQPAKLYKEGQQKSALNKKM
jgi:hypothetical protein